jgi:hypothetical protein
MKHLPLKVAVLVALLPGIAAVATAASAVEGLVPRLEAAATQQSCEGHQTAGYCCDCWLQVIPWWPDKKHCDLTVSSGTYIIECDTSEEQWCPPDGPDNNCYIT